MIVVEVEGQRVEVYSRHHPFVVLRKVPDLGWVEGFRGNAVQVRVHLRRRSDLDEHRIYDVEANEVREVTDDDLGLRRAVST